MKPDLNNTPYPWSVIGLAIVWAIIAGWAVYGAALMLGVAK